MLPNPLKFNIFRFFIPYTSLKYTNYVSGRIRLLIIHSICETVCEEVWLACVRAQSLTSERPAHFSSFLLNFLKINKWIKISVLSNIISLWNYFQNQSISINIDTIVFGHRKEMCFCQTSVFFCFYYYVSIQGRLAYRAECEWFKGFVKMPNLFCRKVIRKAPVLQSVPMLPSLFQ